MQMFDQVSSCDVFTAPLWVRVYRVDSFREAPTKAAPAIPTVLRLHKANYKTQHCCTRIALGLFLTKHRENIGKSYQKKKKKERKRVVIETARNCF